MWVDLQGERRAPDLVQRLFKQVNDIVAANEMLFSCLTIDAVCRQRIKGGSHN